MTTVVFTDGSTWVEFGRATMDAVPRIGESVYLTLSMAFKGSDPLSYARFKVEDIYWEAYNYERVESWMVPWMYEHEVKVMLRVSPLDEKTAAYMQRVQAEHAKLEQEDTESDGSPID